VLRAHLCVMIPLMVGLVQEMEMNFRIGFVLSIYGLHFKRRKAEIAAGRANLHEILISFFPSTIYVSPAKSTSLLLAELKLFNHRCGDGLPYRIDSFPRILLKPGESCGQILDIEIV
jgi:hypothetical protein